MENKKCHENEGYCFLKGTKCPYTEPNAGVSDPTDGRTIYQWESKYPEDAKQEIRLEAMFLFIILFVSLILLFLTWEGWIYLWLPLPPDKVDTLRDYTYYALSGMLGGIIFGMKYFYRVVARGWWHQDRRYWRIMSPFIAMVIAVIIGAMIDASILKTQTTVNGATIVSIGFIAGYFADEAVGKMYELASVLFGKSAVTKGGQDGKEKTC